MPTPAVRWSLDVVALSARPLLVKLHTRPTSGTRSSRTAVETVPRGTVRRRRGMQSMLPQDGSFNNSSSTLHTSRRSTAHGLRSYPTPLHILHAIAEMLQLPICCWAVERTGIEPDRPRHRATTPPPTAPHRPTPAPSVASARCAARSARSGNRHARWASRPRMLHRGRLRPGSLRPGTPRDDRWAGWGRGVGGGPSRACKPGRTGRGR